MHGPGTVCQGKWKYYPWREKKQGRDAPVGRPPSAQPVQLYDLSVDIGEDANLARQHPDICRKMQELYDNHVADITATRRQAATLIRPAGALPPKRPNRNRVKKSK